MVRASIGHEALPKSGYLRDCMAGSDVKCSSERYQIFEVNRFDRSCTRSLASHQLLAFGAFTVPDYDDRIAFLRRLYACGFAPNFVVINAVENMVHNLIGSAF